MQRRDVLLGATGLLTAASPAAAGWTLAGGRSQAARDAFIYALPLLEFAHVRGRTLAAGRANSFQHSRALADHTSRMVTTPNNDTLYSSAMLDLRRGPVALTLPPLGARYQSVALMDAFTNNFAVLGTRTTGTEGGVVIVAGPDSPAVPGSIRAPTPWVWALGRTLVDGPADLIAAHAVQDGLFVEGPSGPEPAAPAVRRDGEAVAVLDAMQALLVENPPPATDAAAFRRMRPAGFGPWGGFDPERLDAAARRELTAGVGQARAFLQAPGMGGGYVQGWSYPRPNLGDFGQDYGYRALVAVAGLAALPPAEALYMRPAGPEGRGVFTGGAWRMRVPAGGLPLDGFWSLTMYEADAAGQLWLVDNPPRRYAIGDRTPGLAKGTDGSIDIWLSADDPGPARRSNWLPAPRRGPWTVTLRTYLPRAELIDGRYRLPPIEAA